MRTSAHTKIEDFSTYRARYTRKKTSKSHTSRLFRKQSHMQPHSMFFKCSNGSNLNFMCRMVLEWREREHGDVEGAVRVDLMAQQALRSCRLYKFWCLGGIRAKPRLPQMLVDYWDLDLESFQIDGMSLTIELEDIYFITGHSRWGEVVNLRSCRPRGGLTIDEYIAMYCYPDTEKVGSQIPTNSI